MRIVFMGTPEFAAEILEELAAVHDVEEVYTMPDRIRGRGKKAIASPVKTVASRLGIPTRTPDTLRDPAELEFLQNLAPDVVCVAAYGMILPKEILDIPRYGCINVHASILPRWRGAAPVERAVLAGDEKVGVSIMRMDVGLDTGDWCVQEAVNSKGKTASELTSELASLGGRLLLCALSAIEKGTAEWKSQDPAHATYADKISKGELYLDPHISAETNFRRVLASSDAHPSKMKLGTKTVTVLSARLLGKDDGRPWVSAVSSDGKSGAPFEPAGESSVSDSCPGEVRFTKKRLFLGTSDGWLELTEVHPDNGRAMPVSSFLAGARLDADAEWTSMNG